MEVYRGIAASPGYAIGKAAVFDREDVPVLERFISAELVDAEVERFTVAVERAKEDIRGLQEKMSREVGEGAAAIFDGHIGILSDRKLNDEMLGRIRNNSYTAEYAVNRALYKYIRRFLALDNELIRERVQDLEDIERRLLMILQGSRPGGRLMATPVVVVAHGLSPSQTASFDREKVLGIATDIGGRTGHAALLARDLGIPAVVGLETASGDVAPGETVIVDGGRGVLIAAPDERTLAKYKEWREAYIGYEKRLTEESHFPAETRDGARVEVFGNIEFPEEIPSVVEHGAEGIGLYRTEFLFLSSGKMPTEEEHLEAYRAALAFLEGRPILVRTLDIGADKVARVRPDPATRVASGSAPAATRRGVAYGPTHPARRAPRPTTALLSERGPASHALRVASGSSPEATRRGRGASPPRGGSPGSVLLAERNPALGCRSIRLCQIYPGMFRTQLRAILRAAAEGNVKCMLPMISTTDEVRWAKGVIEDVKRELAAEGLPFDDGLEVGIMIEVPAAALMADELAQEAAFFSIGTNDLIQYTLAVDRMNEHVAAIFSPAEPSVLRLIQMVIDAGGRHGIPVSMCGEMAGDPLFVTLLVGMGLRQFSVAPTAAPEIKKVVRAVSLEDARALASSVMRLHSRGDVFAALSDQADLSGLPYTKDERDEPSPWE